MGEQSVLKDTGSYFKILRELEDTRIQRELAVAQLMERRRNAYKLAEEREKLNWMASGGAVTTVLSALSSFHHKNLLHLLPIIPIATYVGYSAHFCYGGKANVINKLASGFAENADLSSLNVITVEDVHKRVNDVRNQRAEDELFRQ